MKRGFSTIGWDVVRHHLGGVALVLSADVAGALVLGGADPIVQKLLLDSITERQLRRFAEVSLGVVVLAGVMRMLTYAGVLASQRLRNALARDGVLRAVRNYYRVPFPEATREGSGYFVTRLIDDPSRIANDAVEFFESVVRASVTLCVAWGVGWWLSPRVGLMLIVVVPIVALVSRRSGRHITQATQDVAQNEATLKSAGGRAVDSYRMVVIFDLVGSVTRLISELLDTHLDSQMRRARHVARFRASSSLLVSYADFLVLFAAGVEVLRGHLTIGGLFALSATYSRVISGANGLLSMLPAMAQLRGQLQRVEDFHATAVQESSPRTEPSAAVRLTGATITLGDTVILREVTLELSRPGRTLLEGANGAGKSTLAHVLCGLLTPSSGAFSIPETRNVSALLLPCVFPPGDFLRATGYAEWAPSDRQRFDALAQAFGVADKLEQDPSRLSQGEQRKLQCALALTKDADYYVLDEPLSNIDSASKAVVMSAIMSRTAGKCLIVTMHGDDQFRHMFDRVIVLEGRPGVDDRPVAEHARTLRPDVAVYPIRPSMSPVTASGATASETQPS